MAKDSFPIPQTNLPVGVTTFGPSTAHATMAGASVTLDRTIPNGLNASAGVTAFTIATQFSFDAGATWATYSSSTTQGGTVLDDHGQPALALTETEGWNPPINRGTRARLICTVAGQPVTVVGSVTITG